MGRGSKLSAIFTLLKVVLVTHSYILILAVTAFSYVYIY